MTQPMRIGIIALQHESNTFLPAATTLADFERGILATGDALIRHYAGGHHEVCGFLQGIDEQKLTAVPIFAASATPGGTITSATYRQVSTMLFRALYLDHRPKPRPIKLNSSDLLS